VHSNFGAEWADHMQCPSGEGREVARVLSTVSGSGSSLFRGDSAARALESSGLRGPAPPAVHVALAADLFSLQ
jgi:hypothetical protein